MSLAPYKALSPRALAPAGTTLCRPIIIRSLPLLTDIAARHLLAYWVDGMSRLAAVLHDSTLSARVSADVRAVVANPDWFNATWTRGAADGGQEAEGWVRLVYARGMLAHYDYTGDKDILNFLARAFGEYRASDSKGARSLTQIEALLEAHAYGAPSSLVKTALDMMTTSPAATSFVQAALGPCDAAAVARGKCLNHQHGVTFNEVAKLFALASRWMPKDGPLAATGASFLNASVRAYEMVASFNVQVHGVNSANEALAGIGPNVATETCDVSDFMYSSQWMLRILGLGVYGDRLERAFFNAAPGAVNRTFSGHVYYQSPNMVNTSRDAHIDPELTDPRWAETWYHTPPCCTGNQVRMLPNWIHHQWFGTPDGGVAAALHGPSVLNTTVNGASLAIVTTTDYPFKETLTYAISAAGTGVWTLRLRVPEWCTGATVAVNGGQPVPAVPDPSGFASLRYNFGAAPAGKTTVILRLPMTLRAEVGKTFANGDLNIGPYDPAKEPWARFPGQNGTEGGVFCSVSYGPLAFALPLEARSVHNYALACNASSMVLQRSGAPVGSESGGVPFDWPLEAPLKVVAQASRVVWPDVWALPNTTVAIGGPLEPITLVPYGCAKQYHISLFPVLG